jgi:hypothetical protein
MLWWLDECKGSMIGLSLHQTFRVGRLKTTGRILIDWIAFMVRRAAAVLLDIQDHELKSGIRSVEDPAGGVAGQIFPSRVGTKHRLVLAELAERLLWRLRMIPS